MKEINYTDPDIREFHEDSTDSYWKVEVYDDNFTSVNIRNEKLGKSLDIEFETICNMCNFILSRRN